MKPDIALIGKMGSGKTTAANHLIDHHGYTVMRFSGELKRIAGELWDEPSRDDLQRLGVAVREIRADTWVDLLVDDIIEHGALHNPIVVDDCRFPNEYEALAARGFRFIRVIAHEDQRVDRLQRINRLDDMSQLHHESETALDNEALYPTEGALYNTSDADAFVAQLDEYLSREAARV